MLLSVFLIACDTNDNNNPNTPCEAHFYTVAADFWDASVSSYEVYRYQKSDVLSTPDILYSGNPFSIIGGYALTRANATLDDNANMYVFTFPGVSSQEYFKYDAVANTFNRLPLADIFNPEFVNNQLRFLSFSSSDGVNWNFSIKDENNNIVSQTHSITTSSLLNTGNSNWFQFLSTTDRQNKLFYLQNTLLLEYDFTANSWTEYIIDNFDNANNKVYYRGFEYVGNNSFYALKGDETDPNNIALELVKIDINGNSVQVNVLKDLTNVLSVSASDVIGPAQREWINSTYDACDNSYYFKVSYMGSVSTRLFEIKLESNTINENIISNKILYGLNIGQ